MIKYVSQDQDQDQNQNQALAAVFVLDSGGHSEWKDHLQREFPGEQGLESKVLTLVPVV